MRILAVDLGKVRTGLAICDEGELLASPLLVVQEYDQQRLLERILQVIAQEKPQALVVGLPKNMDGTEGARAELCRAFADELKERCGLPVAMWDERRTTVEAHNILSAHNYHGQKRKNTVDAVAASLILEGYLAYRKR